MKKKGQGSLGTTGAALIFVILSFIIAFLMLQRSDPLADTADHGVETIRALDELNEQLEQAP
jgi:hypothetical protein